MADACSGCYGTGYTGGGKSAHAQRHSLGLTQFGKQNVQMRKMEPQLLSNRLYHHHHHHPVSQIRVTRHVDTLFECAGARVKEEPLVNCYKVMWKGVKMAQILNNIIVSRCTTLICLYPSIDVQAVYACIWNSHVFAAFLICDSSLLFSQDSFPSNLTTLKQMF